MSLFSPLRAFVLLLALSACDTPSDKIYTLTRPTDAVRKILPTTPSTQFIPRAQARNAVEIAFVRGMFDVLQRRSISENVEYCGFIALTPAGALTATQPARGEAAGCEFNQPPANLRLLASYHTHAAYDSGFDNEVPSVLDLEGDISDQLDGYVSTPGGRIWYNDARAQTVNLQCNLSCVYADPGFRQDVQDPINPGGYTLASLRARQR